MDEGLYLAVVKELGHIPDKMKEVLKLNDRIAELSKIFTYAHNFIYLGRGYSYPVALEGALKLKEISYIHAEGYPAAEMSTAIIRMPKCLTGGHYHPKWALRKGAEQYPGNKGA